MSAREELDFATTPLDGEAMHGWLRALRDEGPVVPVRFIGRPSFLITTHAALLEAFRDTERFPPAPIYRLAIGDVVGRTFQTMEGEEHRIHRRLATPAFRSRAIERFEREGMARLAHELLDRLDPRAEVDLARGFTRLYPFIVISRMLGVPRDAEALFHRWALQMLGAPMDRAAGLRAAAEFTRYLRPVVAARRAEPRGDVISELAAAEVEGRRLDDEAIFSQLRLLFSAGATTTHDALGNLLHLLLSEPERWKAVVEDPGRRPGAIEEALRLETPVPNLPRLSAPQPIVFTGVEIPANTIVLFSMSAANRDPAVWEAPDRFDPERSGEAMLTFGRGERSCPGMHLARKEIATALDVLIERVPTLRLVGDPAESAPRGAIVRGPGRLRVRG